MKRIYILDEYISSTRNGIGTFVGEFVSCLKGVDVSVHLVIFNADCREFAIMSKGDVTYMYFPEFKGKEYVEYPEVIVKFFRLYIQDSPDTLFCVNHFPSNKLIKSIRESHPLSKMFFVIHNQSWTAAFEGDVRKFERIHSDGEAIKKSPLYGGTMKLVEMEQEAYEMVDHVVCLTNATRQLLLDVYGVPQNKIWLIPNGLKRKHRSLDSERRKRLRAKYFISDEEKVVLFVGRLEKTKGVYALLDAFKSVLESFPNAKLVMAGTDIYSSFNHQDNYIKSRVVYAGQLKPSVLQQWYQMADIGVIPSYTEQCSYVGIEMMMHSLPIVASDGFGVRDMFKDGENAIVAPIGRRTGKAKTFSANLAQALISLLSSAELRKKMGRNAREVYLKCYSLAKMKEGYKRLLDALE
ncbi:glycosyltransferase [uncultured Bacteroides sp.]|uniref:glycosyltransferase n=1 Tax=uncultured Bacteroides sp. TaxID=162156 RepID=UPI002600A125|nr:glycosyltransferase [uncultured Bacteroides sp.]